MRTFRLACAAVAAMAALLPSNSAVIATGADATPEPSVPFDKTCFELPVVVVTPTNERLPTETCNQQRYPALDCMKTPVRVDLEVIDNTNGSLNCLHGARTSVHASTAHYRGQSSLHFSKHQLTVRLHRASAFLGFPADSKFVLNGPVIDTSLLRNHLAHWLFRGTTRYSPRTRHVIVFIRDRLEDFEPAYKGIYLALEKITYGPNRVGLAPLDHTCRGEERSGGWAWQNNPLNYGVYSPNIVLDKYQAMFGSGERPVLMYPPAKKLSQRLRDYFVDPTTGPLPRLYAHLYDNMTDPGALARVLDVGSFVDYFLHSEMSQNSDAYRRSAYFFKDRGQPINAGPVWDFNLAYGKGANQRDWLYKPHAFWRRLACHYQFAALVPQRWRALRRGPWSDAAIGAFLAESAAPIARQLARCQGGWTSAEMYCAHVRADRIAAGAVGVGAGVGIGVRVGVGAGAEVDTGATAAAAAAAATPTFDETVRALAETVTARAAWMDERVATLFMSLNGTVCVPVGALPQFNCAANGSDGGCLADPERYIDAVSFPPVRTRWTPAAGACAPPAPGERLEAPSIDYCWLSAGVPVAQSTLTPFCSGYGYCEPGPGAACKCVQGKCPPACAADQLSASLPSTGSSAASSPSSPSSPSSQLKPAPSSHPSFAAPGAVMWRRAVDGLSNAGLVVVVFSMVLLLLFGATRSRGVAGSGDNVTTSGRSAPTEAAAATSGGSAGAAASGRCATTSDDGGFSRDEHRGTGRGGCGASRGRGARGAAPDQRLLADGSAGAPNYGT